MWFTVAQCAKDDVLVGTIQVLGKNGAQDAAPNNECLTICLLNVGLGAPVFFWREGFLQVVQADLVLQQAGLPDMNAFR